MEQTKSTNQKRGTFNLLLVVWTIFTIILMPTAYSNLQDDQTYTSISSTNIIKLNGWSKLAPIKQGDIIANTKPELTVQDIDEKTPLLSAGIAGVDFPEGCCVTAESCFRVASSGQSQCLHYEPGDVNCESAAVLQNCTFGCCVHIKSGDQKTCFIQRQSDCKADHPGDQGFNFISYITNSIDCQNRCTVSAEDYVDVMGTVKDEQTQLPISLDKNPKVEVIRQYDQQKYTGNVAPNGDFIIPNVPKIIEGQGQTNVVVEATADDYDPKSYNYELRTISEPIVLAITLRKTAVDTGSVAGNCYEQDPSSPLENCTITWQGLSTLSGSNGYYNLDGITAGDQSITGVYNGTYTITKQVVVATGGTTTTDFNFTFPEDIGEGCGNNVVDRGEQCDGTSDTRSLGATYDCEGKCIPEGQPGECTCMDTCAEVGGTCADFKFLCEKATGQSFTDKYADSPVLIDDVLKQNIDNDCENDFNKLSGSRVDPFGTAVCCMDNSTSLPTIPVCIDGGDGETIEVTKTQSEKTPFEETGGYMCQCGNPAIRSSIFWDINDQPMYCCHEIAQPYPCSESYVDVNGYINDNRGQRVPSVSVTFKREGGYEKTFIADNVGYYSTDGDNQLVKGDNYTVLLTPPDASHKYREVKDISMLESRDDLNFEIEWQNTTCSGDIQKPTVTLSNIRGIAHIMVNWTQICNDNVFQFFLYRDGQQIPATFPRDRSNQYGYIDTGPTGQGLDWDRTYTYRVQVLSRSAKYNETDATIYTGNQSCEGMFDDDWEFCTDLYFLRQPTYEKRVKCRDNNVMQEIDQCKTALEPDSVCLGPDLANKTWCRTQDICPQTGTNETANLNWFGMFSEFFYDVNPPEQGHNCTIDLTEVMPDGQPQRRGCYYDSYDDWPPFTTDPPTFTIKEQCLTCDPSDSCYVYQTEGACLQDNCQHGPRLGSECKWKDDTAYTDLGKGICYVENYTDTRYCSLCSGSGSGNQRLFFNTFCTQDMCDVLGRCYSANQHSKCEPCSTSTICETYRDAEVCERNSKSFSIPPLQCYNNTQEITFTKSNFAFNYGDDPCGFKRCIWLEGQATPCVKDADSDGIADCSIMSCWTDFQAPYTTITQRPTIVNLHNGRIEFYKPGDTEISYFCIDSNSDNICCPVHNMTRGETAINISSPELMQLFNLVGIEEERVLRYFSIDENKNIEEIKNETFWIDTIKPTITLDYVISNNTQNNLTSDINLTINVSEDVIDCAGHLNPGDRSGLMISGEIKNNESGKDRFQNLIDGSYLYDIECTDLNGNKGNASVNIYLERIHMIYNQSPDVSAAPDFGKIPIGVTRFFVTTNPYNGSSMSCCYERTSPGPLGPKEYYGSNGRGVRQGESYLHSTYDLSLDNNSYTYQISCYQDDCRFGQNPLALKQISFTIDQVPPITTLLYEEGPGSFAEIDESIFYSKSTRFSFSCNDSDPRLTFPAPFGCSETKYCITNETICTALCDPDNATCTDGDSISSPQAIFSNKPSGNHTLCVQSMDTGGALEPSVCKSIMIDDDGALIDFLEPTETVLDGHLPTHKFVINFTDSNDIYFNITWTNSSNMSQRTFTEGISPGVPTTVDIPLFVGQNRVTVVTRDEKGNPNSTEKIFFVDTIGPALSDSSLELCNGDGTRVSGDRVEYKEDINFNVTVNDTIMTGQVEKVQAQIVCDSDECGNFFRIFDIPLDLADVNNTVLHTYLYNASLQQTFPIGTYNITILAFDRFGFSSNITRQFTVIDTILPTIDIAYKWFNANSSMENIIRNPYTNLPRISGYSEGSRAYSGYRISINSSELIQFPTHANYSLRGDSSCGIFLTSEEDISEQQSPSMFWNFIVVRWIDPMQPCLENTEDRMFSDPYGNAKFNFVFKDVNNNTVNTDRQPDMVVSNRLFEIDTAPPSYPSLTPDLDPLTYSSNETISFIGSARTQYGTGEPNAVVNLSMKINGTENQEDRFTKTIGPNILILETTAAIAAAQNQSYIILYATNAEVTNYTFGKYLEFTNHERRSKKRYKITSANPLNNMVNLSLEQELEQAVLSGETTTLYSENDEAPTGWFEFNDVPLVLRELGNNTLSFSVTDMMENTGPSVNKTIIVDKSVPIFDIKSPMPNDVINDNTTKIELKIIDNIKLNKSSILFVFNNSNYTCSSGQLQCVSDTNDRTMNISFTPSSNLPNGDYNASISVKDSLGLFNSTYWEFSIDSNVPDTPILISIYGSNSGKRGSVAVGVGYTNITSTDLALKVQFNNTEEIQIDNASLYGIPGVEASCTYVPGIASQYECKFDTSLNETNYKLRIDARKKLEGDFWSSAGRYSIDFTIDQTPPQVNIDKLPLATANTLINITGTYIEDNIANITISGNIIGGPYDFVLAPDGRSVIYQDLPIDIQSKLKTPVTLTFSGKDLAGNINITQQTFTYDAEAAPVNLDQVRSPLGPNIGNSGSINLTGHTNEFDVRVTLRINRGLQHSYWKDISSSPSVSNMDIIISDGLRAPAPVEIEAGANITFKNMLGDQVGVQVGVEQFNLDSSEMRVYTPPNPGVYVYTITLGADPLQSNFTVNALTTNFTLERVNFGSFFSQSGNPLLVDVEARDTLDNYVTSPTQYVVYDNEIPEITKKIPNDDDSVNQQRPNITLVIEDNIGINKSTLQFNLSNYSYDYATLQAKGAVFREKIEENTHTREGDDITQLNISFTPDFDLENKAYAAASLTVKDNAENSLINLYRFYVDTNTPSRPNFKFETNLGEGAYISNNKTLITILFSQDVVVEDISLTPGLTGGAFLPGGPTELEAYANTTDNRTFVLDLNQTLKNGLSDGTYALSVSAYRIGINITGSWTTNFTIDTKYPKITITNPSHGTKTKSPLPISGLITQETVDSILDLELRFNNRLIPADETLQPNASGGVTYTLNPGITAYIDEITYNINVNVIDKTGYESNKSINVSYDPNEPILSNIQIDPIASLAKFQYPLLLDKDFDLSFDANEELQLDSGSIRITNTQGIEVLSLQNITLEKNSTTYSFSASLESNKIPQHDIGTVVVKAKDLIGNEGNLSYNLTLDKSIIEYELSNPQITQFPEISNGVIDIAGLSDLGTEVSLLINTINTGLRFNVHNTPEPPVINNNINPVLCPSGRLDDTAFVGANLSLYNEFGSDILVTGQIAATIGPGTSKTFSLPTAGTYAYNVGVPDIPGCSIGGSIVIQELSNVFNLTNINLANYGSPIGEAYNVQVEAKDVFETTKKSTVKRIVIDEERPNMTNKQPVGVIAETNPTISGKITDNYKLIPGGNIVFTITDSNTGANQTQTLIPTVISDKEWTFSYKAQGLADQTSYDIEISVQDLARNQIDLQTGSWSFLVDQSIPRQPTYSFIEDYYFNTTSPTLDVVFKEIVNLRSVEIDGQDVMDSVTTFDNISYSITTNELSESLHTITLRANKIGLEEVGVYSRTFYIDVTSPSTPAISSPSHLRGVRLKDKNPMFNFTAIDNLGIAGYSVEISRTPTPPDNISDQEINSKQYASLDDGDWTFYVRAVDNAGNWGLASSYNISIDNTKPLITNIDLTPVVMIESTRTAAKDSLNIYFNTSEQVHIPLIRVVGGDGIDYSLRTAMISETGNHYHYAFSVPTDNEISGRFYINISATDIAGNTNSTVEQFSISTKKIKFSDESPGNHDVMSDYVNTISIKANLDSYVGIDPQSIYLEINGNKVNPNVNIIDETGGQTAQINYTNDSLPGQAYTIRVFAKDNLGIESSKQWSFSVERPQCSDRLDNDQDSFADYCFDHTKCDIGCDSQTDNSETDHQCTGEQCCDTGDNDIDTLIDYCFIDGTCDDGCSSLSDTNEAEPVIGEICYTSEDDDQDGKINCDDEDCEDYASCENPEICDNSIDDDGDTKIDCEDADCVIDLVLCPPTGNEDCNDGIDNDNDGLIDCLDIVDCTGYSGCENPEICDDLVDNDQDGKTDCSDPDCQELQICVQEKCNDGIDNDNDGFTDCLDIDCLSFSGCQPDEICNNTLDDDSDYAIDCLDSDCQSHESCNETEYLEICDNGIDDDNNGLIDCLDPRCSTFHSCPEICTNGLDDDEDGLTDCDDADCGPEVCMPEDCNDGIDNDNNGLIDCLDDFCRLYSMHCKEDGAEICDNGVNDDEDLLVDCDDPDCQDECEVQLKEICNNQIDDNNNGLVDCDDPFCNQTFKPCQNTVMEICGNFIDDDVDTKIDCEDPDCHHLPECGVGITECNDGMDNDDDGLTDYCFDDGGCDPGCDSLEDNSEGDFAGVPYPSIYINDIPIGSAKYLNKAVNMFRFEYSDNVSVIGLYIDNQDIIISNIVASNNNKTFTYKSIPLSNGNHTMRISAQNIHGYTNNISFVFTVDITSPIININDDTKKLTNNHQINLNGTIIEDNLKRIIISGDVVEQGSEVPTEDILFIGEDKFFDIPLTLTKSSSTVTLTVEDKAGNTNSDKITIKVDTEKPIFSISEVTDSIKINNAHYRTQKDSVMIKGTITKPQSTISVFDDPEIFGDISGTTFSITVPIIGTSGDTDNKVTLLSKDQAGNTFNQTITITKDMSPPIITIISPIPIRDVPPVFASSETKPSFVIKTNERSNCILNYLDKEGTSISVGYTSTDKLTHSITLIQPLADNVYTESIVTCSDMYNNPSKIEFSVFTDTRKPKINEINVAYGYLNTMDAQKAVYEIFTLDTKITIDVTEPVLCKHGPTKGYNSMEKFKGFDNKNYSVKLESEEFQILDKTNNTIFIDCEDIYGNRMSAPYKVYIYADTTAPIRVANPKPIGYNKDRNPMISVDTMRPSDCKITIQNSDKTKTMNSFDDGASYKHTIMKNVLDPLLLFVEDEAYSFNVTCTDINQVLQPGLLNFSFVFDSAIEPPRIIYPEEGFSANSSMITLMGETEPGASYVVYVNDNAQNRPMGADSEGFFETQIFLDTGLNKVKVEVEDKAKNQNSASVTGSYTSVGTVIKYLIPFSGSKLNNIDKVIAIIQDSGLGIVYASSKIVVEDEKRNLVRGTMSDDSGNRIYFTPTNGFEDGEYFVSAKVTDKRGNTNFKRSFFTINSAVPIITMRNPPMDNVLITTESEVDFDGVVESPTPITIAEWEFNRHRASGTSESICDDSGVCDSDGVIQFTKLKSILEGENRYAVRAMNELGKGTAYYKSAVVLDSKGPDDPVITIQ